MKRVNVTVACKMMDEDFSIVYAEKGEQELSNHVADRLLQIGKAEPIVESVETKPVNKEVVVETKPKARGRRKKVVFE